ncbi:MAG: DUF2461 domain-containing protein [Saprospiraceae bacterium]
MLTQKALDFLKDLTKNNNRDWFQSNKARYETDLKKPFEHFIGEIIREIQKSDPQITIEPKKAIFRINRDTRFSKDKSPYKTNVGALISRAGTKVKELPGFYIHLEQGVFMLGGGAYFLEKEPLYQVRQHIMLHPQRFKDIINHPTFKDKFEEGVLGEKNKKLPAEFIQSAKQQPLLYNKQYYVMAELDPKTILQDDVISLVMAHYQAMKPLNDFLIEALQM